MKDLARGLHKTFINRLDTYPVQQSDGSYLRIKKKLTGKHIIQHLKKELTLGSYALSADSMTKYIVFDADDDAEHSLAISMGRFMQDAGLPVYIEQSRRGVHVWMFFSKPIKGKYARQFGRGLIKSFQLPEGIELFPKQDVLSNVTNVGSLIRLPFGVHKKSGVRYGFVDGCGKLIAPTVSEQVRMLVTPKYVTTELYRRFYRLGKVVKPKRFKRKITNDNIGEIKESIHFRDFAEDYVDSINPYTGKALCPFHEDQHHSFSIFDDGWKCYAGCGHGDIFDFWMKLKGVDLKTAIKQLKRMSEKGVI